MNNLCVAFLCWSCFPERFDLELDDFDDVRVRVTWQDGTPYPFHQVTHQHQAWKQPPKIAAFEKRPPVSPGFCGPLQRARSRAQDEWFIIYSNVLPTSHEVYVADKPQNSMLSCFVEMLWVTDHPSSLLNSNRGPAWPITVCVQTGSSAEINSFISTVKPQVY